MKTAIKSNWLIIVLMALVVCFTGIGIATLNLDRSSSQNGTVVAEEIATDPTLDATEITEATKNGSTRYAVDSFYMKQGASVRVQGNTSGMRYTAYLNNTFLSYLKAMYPETSYTYTIYMEFQRQGQTGSGADYDKRWVSTTLNSGGALGGEVADFNTICASLSYGSLTEDQLENAKFWEITANAKLVIEGKADGENVGEKYVVNSVTNDNVRSAFAVVNAALLNGEQNKFSNLNVIVQFVKENQTLNTIPAYLEIANGENNSVMVTGFEGAVKTAYFGATKVTATASEGVITVSDIATVSENYLGENKYLAVVESNGKVWNVPAVYVTKAIKTDSDLSVLVDADATAKTIVTGYYVLANDIEHSGTWNGNTLNNNSYFGGTFDGNGHYIDLQLGTGGLFSGLATNATIKNVAILINNQSTAGKVDDARFILSKNASVSGNNLQIFISDVFVDVNVDATNGTANMSMIANAGSWVISYNNAIIDFADGVITPTKSQGGVFATYLNDNFFTAEGDYYKYINKGNEFNNTYYINSDFKYAVKLSTGHYAFAENDTEFMASASVGDGIKKVYLPGVKRYDNYTAMAAANLDLTSFNSTCWDTALGYPVFNSLIKNHVTLLVDSEISSTASLTLDEGGSSSATITGSYAGSSITPVLSTDSDIVTVEDNVIYAVANKYGTATVAATFTVNGTSFTKDVEVTVTLPGLTGEIMYSSMDGKIYLHAQYNEANVDSIVLASDDTVLYTDGANTADMPNNTASADLTDYTKSVVIGFKDGTKYTATLVAYTMVIAKDSDLSVLVDADATATTIISGYYILANNIERGEWTGNVYNSYSYFAGTLDGNGYYIDLQLSTGGLFSGLTTSATIKNVGILVNNKANGSGDDRRYIFAKTISKDSTNNKQIYITDVLFDVNVDATSGSANMAITASSNSHVITYSNVVVDFADGVITPTKAQGGIFVNYFNIAYIKATGDDITGDGNADYKYTWADSFIDTYYINKDFKYVGALQQASNGNLVFAENDGAFMASVDTTSTGYTKAYAPGVYRYDDYTAMAGANLDLTSFNSACWDTTAGYPVWKQIAIKQALENTKYYLGNSDSATEVDLENSGNNNSVSLYAEYNSMSYNPVLTVVSGNTVTVENNVITAVAQTSGESVVEALYNLDGNYVTKTYIINVVYPEFTGGQLMWSTKDSQLFTPYEFNGKQILSIVDANNGVEYYGENGITENVVNNNDSSDLTNYSTQVYIDFADGTGYKIDLVSYTKVINEEEDLEVLVDSAASTKTTVNGYYILANNIEHTGNWAGNKLNSNSYFAGTFDGNGYYIDLQLGTGGLFSGLATNATIKNVAILINNVASVANNGNTNAIFANNTSTSGNNKQIFFNDVFVDVNVDACTKTSYPPNMMLIASSISHVLKYTNVIFDFAEGVLEAPVGDSSGKYGPMGTYFNTAHVTKDGEDITGDGTADKKYNYEENYTNTYYINKDFKYLGGYYNGGTLVNLIYAANDGTFMKEDTSAVTTKAYVPTIYRYDDYTAMANDTTNNGLATFSSAYWDTTEGYPVWKSLDIVNATLTTVNDEAGNTVDLVYSSDNETAEIAFEYKTSVIPADLTIVEGSGLVQINGNVISLGDSPIEGTAKVKAQALVNGVVVADTITVNVSLNDLTSKQVMFSTLDNAFNFSQYDKTVMAVVGEDAQTVYYDNSGSETVISVPTELQNLNSSELYTSDGNTVSANDLTAFTKTVLVVFEDGSIAKTTFVSYTKVIDEDDDFLVFEYDANAETNNLYGYYILSNDITLDSWEGNMHSNKSGGVSYGKFYGVLDGNGYTAEIALKNHGILPALADCAVVKDIALIVKSINGTGRNNASVIAPSASANGARPIYISNVYVKYDLPSDYYVNTSFYDWATPVGLSLISSEGYNNNLSNIVVDMSSVQMQAESNPYRYGAIYSSPISTTIDDEDWSNVYVLKADKYVLYNAEYEKILNEGSDTGTATIKNTIALAAFASNDQEAYSSCAATAKVLLANTKRFDSMSAAVDASETFAGLVADLSGLWTLDVNGALMFNGNSLA